MELVDILGGHAEGGVGLEEDPEGAAKEVEIVDVEGPQVGLEGEEEVGQAHPQGLGLLAVDVEEDLRRLGTESGHGAPQPRVFIGMDDEALEGLGQFLRGLTGQVEQFHLDAAGGAQALDRRRGEGEDRRLRDGQEPGLDAGQHGLGAARRARAFVPVLEDGDGHAAAGAHARQQAEARDGHHMVDLRLGGQGLLDLGQDGAGPRQGGGVGQGDVDEEIARVLAGDEAGGDLVEQPAGAGGGSGDDQHRHQGDAPQGGHKTGVTPAAPVQQGEEPAQGAARGAGGPQQQAAEGRAQGQGDERGQGHRHRDGHRELEVELAGDAGQEGGGHEDRVQHQGGGDDGSGDLGHGPLGRLLGAQLLLVDEALGVLDHDDGVIDDDADGEDDREQGDGIDGQPRRQQHGEGADDRPGDGQDRHQGGAPVTEEGIGDQDDQPQGLEHGDDHVAQADAHEVGGVVIDVVFEIVGEALGELFQGGVDPVGRLQGVGAGGEIDAQHRRGHAIDPGIGIVVLRPEFDAGDIAQTHHGAVGIGADQDALELLRLGEAPLGLEGVGECAALIVGRGAQAAGGGLEVLAADGIRHLGLADAQGGHHLRIEPDAHGVVEGAELARVADPWQARQGVAQVDLHVVGEEEPVEGPLGRQQVDREQHVGGLLAHRDPLLDHLDRQGRLGQGHAVLDIDGGDIRVGADGEGDIQPIAARVVAGRVHVQHVIDAVDLGLDGRGHSLGEDLGVGAGVEGLHRDLGRHDVRELGHRQDLDGDEAGDDDHQGDHHREARAVDEEGGKHGFSLPPGGRRPRAPPPCRDAPSGCPPRSPARPPSARRGPPSRCPGARPA